MKRIPGYLVSIVICLGLVGTACGDGSRSLPTSSTAGGPSTDAQHTTPSPGESLQATASSARLSGYPLADRPVTLIVPWPAGGSTDQVGRLVASMLEEELDARVMVLNKPGASSQTGMTEFARSAPDAYTLALTSIPSTITPYLDPERKAIYSRQHIRQVANLTWDPEVVVVRADSKFKTLQDLIDSARSEPGQIRMASSGIQSDTHLAILLLQQASGVEFNTVHFGGSTEVTTALLGGHVDAAIHSGSGVLQQVRSGEFRALGVFDRQETEFFPGVKTLESQGYRLYWASSRGVSTPAGTPEDRVTRLANALRSGMDTADFAKKLKDMGQVGRYMGPMEYAEYWDEVEALAKPLILPEK